MHALLPGTDEGQEGKRNIKNLEVVKNQIAKIK